MATKFWPALISLAINSQHADSRQGKNALNTTTGKSMVGDKPGVLSISVPPYKSKVDLILYARGWAFKMGSVAGKTKAVRLGRGPRTGLFITLAGKD